jgi:hypothetical protein
MTPMSSPHDGPAPGDLSALVLGLLDAEQTDEVARHVQGCAVCRREYEELQEMAEMLGELPPEVYLDGPPDDGDLLLARTVRQVRRESTTRRRRRLLGAAAAAVIAVAAAIGGGVLIGRSAGAPTVESIQAAGTRVLDGTGAGAVRMKATVSPAAEWVRLAVTVSGVPRGEHCKLIVVRKDGSREVAGSWTVGPRGEENGITIDGSADIPIAEVAAVNVEGSDGGVYVSALT